MSFMRMLGMGGISPLGVLVAGALLGAAGVPVVKKGARLLAVTAVCAALAASDHLKNTGSSVNQEWQNILNEARSRKDGAMPMREHLHEAGVGLAGAGLSVARHTREKFNDLRESIENKMAGPAETPEGVTGENAVDGSPLPGDYMTAGIDGLLNDKKGNSDGL